MGWSMSDMGPSVDRQIRQNPRFPCLARLTETDPVRSPLGRDARNSLTRMAPAPGFGRPAPSGFGMGSVGEGGSVGREKTR